MSTPIQTEGPVLNVDPSQVIFKYPTPPDPRLSFFSYFIPIKFPAGEMHVQFELERYDAAWNTYKAWCEAHGAGASHVKDRLPMRPRVTLRSGHADDVFVAILMADAARRMGVRWPGIDILYLPYARQDRVANYGESLSLKVMCDLINLHFSDITILDPHSDVSSGLLRNPQIINQAEAMLAISDDLTREEVAYNPFADPKVVLVCPDMGARKKIDHVAKALGDRRVIYCDKKRDTKTGKLSGFHVNTTGELCDADTNFLIVDDLIDGGGTFIGIADILRQTTAGKVFLAASFGIFSRGTCELAAAFDHIYVAETATFERTFSQSFTNAKAFSK